MRAAKELQRSVSCRCLLLYDFVKLKREPEVPAQYVHAVGLGRILSRANGAFEFPRNLRHTANAEPPVKIYRDRLSAFGPGLRSAPRQP
jgi:hypothetical protein